MDAKPARLTVTGPACRPSWTFSSASRSVAAGTWTKTSTKRLPWKRPRRSEFGTRSSNIYTSLSKLFRPPLIKVSFMPGIAWKFCPGRKPQRRAPKSMSRHKARTSSPVSPGSLPSSTNALPSLRRERANSSGSGPAREPSLPTKNGRMAFLTSTRPSGESASRASSMSFSTWRISCTLQARPSRIWLPLPTAR